ncbi:nodulation protein NolT [Rhodomicrobium udaipurense JA643]|uniref:Lipoprotein n=1 Tax=Rhodomicrobium udaipurense TaxID=1202716 RepID=A0A8I1GG15_9HYPH|nr:type III secretion inner membrane ring lipoprotein SctJ [Rhodomicrobium udaipurense]KAI95300.1 nodulation protein NolT [Rhodomicrobium udaipurense JA643]MBJ7544444.1 type III secretion inner membrane ring lipoprotein SctJ [Rhodomicrobium udaipurense]
MAARVPWAASLSRGLAAAGLVFALSACNVDLYSKLSEGEANEIVALLLRNHIQASRVVAKDGSSVVRVDEAAFADAMSLLSDAGLPRQKFASIGDVFADNKLVSSPTEERARFIYALSQELSKTLSEIDGVLAARVHLVLPKNDPLREEQKPSSASVFIKHDPAASLAPLLPQIKTLVTNSIEGLSYDKVSVVFVPGQKLHRAADTASSPARATLLNSLPVPLLIGGAIAGWFVALALLLGRGSRPGPRPAPAPLPAARAGGDE